jgi:hypothetical protein
MARAQSSGIPAASQMPIKLNPSMDHNPAARPRAKVRFKLGLALCVALGFALWTPSGADAQTATAAAQAAPSPTGWTGFVQTQYGAASFYNVIIANVDLGYSLTDHLTVDAGLPVIWTRNSYSPVIDHDYYWSTLLGEPYLDARYSSTYKELKYTSVLTGTIPAGNQDKTYVTGRVGVDWFNHVEDPMGSLTPFVNFGASNGAVNQFIMPRPYNTARPFQTLGFLGDIEAGADYKINRKHVHDVKVGASYYVLVPGGPQKIYSRLVFPYSVLAGDGRHLRYYDSTFESTVGKYGSSLIVSGVYGVNPSKGVSSISRDNGYSTWLDITRWHPLDVQIAYTRSVHYALDVYTVTLTFDAQNMIRSLMPHH